MSVLSLKKQVVQAVLDADLGFKAVEGAADLKAILAGRVTTPGCYVYRERNMARPNSTGTQYVVQPKTEYIALLVVTRNVAGALGDAQADENEALCDSLQSSLLGFVPDEFTNPLEYSGGQLILNINGLCYWREIYNSTRYIRSR